MNTWPNEKHDARKEWNKRLQAKKNERQRERERERKKENKQKGVLSDAYDIGLSEATSQAFTLYYVYMHVYILIRGPMMPTDAGAAGGTLALMI